MEGLEEFDSLTVLKYTLNGGFHYHVMDKFEEPDEPARLDRMIEFSKNMALINGKGYKELWIKTCPIFPTK